MPLTDATEGSVAICVGTLGIGSAADESTRVPTESTLPTQLLEPFETLPDVRNVQDRRQVLQGHSKALSTEGNAHSLASNAHDLVYVSKTRTFSQVGLFSSMNFR